MSESLLTCGRALDQATARIDSDSPRLDAELLLARVTGHSRSRFRAFPEQILSAGEQQAFEALVVRRARGEPVAYILGQQEFWSLPLAVGPGTLIPRPDTESLVEAALTLPVPARARVLDLGTGTGAIALALASERHGWQVDACDTVPEAVALARDNAARLALPLRVMRSHWFADLVPARYDLIVANPPYVAAGDDHLIRGDLRFEPATALVSGSSGLDDLGHIVATAPDWLAPAGWLVVEHGFDQGGAVRQLFADAGFSAIATRCDYGGQERLTLGIRHAGPEPAGAESDREDTVPGPITKRDPRC